MTEDHVGAPLHSSRGYLFVALAACLWGTLGFLFRVLHDQFFLNSLTVAFLRATMAFTALFLFALVTRRQALRISPRDIPFYALFGLCAVSAFYFLYIQAVVTTSVTTAVVLLYTAPAFVSVMAWRFWHEPMNARKMTAIAVTFIGCALIARVYDTSVLQLNVVGLFLGLGAGFTYALYTIFSKFALAQHESLTTLIYALFFGAIFLVPFQSAENLALVIQRPMAWLVLLLLALGPTVGAYALYNAGLTRVPASNASLMATLEPVMASVLAYLVLGERLEIAQIIGGVLVVIAAVWVRTRLQAKPA